MLWYQSFRGNLFRLKQIWMESLWLQKRGSWNVGFLLLMYEIFHFLGKTVLLRHRYQRFDISLGNNVLYPKVFALHFLHLLFDSNGFLMQTSDFPIYCLSLLLNWFFWFLIEIRFLFWYFLFSFLKFQAEYFLIIDRNKLLFSILVHISNAIQYNLPIFDQKQEIWVLFFDVFLLILKDLALLVHFLLWNLQLLHFLLYQILRVFRIQKHISKVALL